MTDTREMQLSFLKERSENIDIQIRKHQARLHTVQTKLAAQYDDALDAEVRRDIEFQSTTIC